MRRAFSSAEHGATRLTAKGDVDAIAIAIAPEHIDCAPADVGSAFLSARPAEQRGRSS
jgi:hypothetical protein